VEEGGKKVSTACVTINKVSASCGRPERDGYSRPRIASNGSGSSNIASCSRWLSCCSRASEAATAAAAAAATPSGRT